MVDEPLEVQIAVRIEKDDPRQLTEVAANVGEVLLNAFWAGRGSYSFEDYHKGRIRKIVKAAHENKFSKLTGYYVADQANVAIYEPVPHIMMPDELRKLQLEGWHLNHDNPDMLCRGDEAPLLIAVNPQFNLYEHPGKAIAQIAHAYHIAWLSEREAQWEKDDWGAYIYWPDAEHWETDVERADLIVTDAGFTVLAPGSLTVVARWCDEYGPLDKKVHIS